MYGMSMTTGLLIMTTGLVIVEPVPTHLHVAADGRRLMLRRAAEGDRAAIVGLYEHLSLASRRYRFHLATPRLSSQLRDFLTDLDRAEVWVAFDGDVCVGEARISPGGDGAELALTITDHYQHIGIGRHLAQVAIENHAGDHRWTTVSILAENTTAVRMATRQAIPLHLDGAVLEGQIPIPPHQEELTTMNRHDPKIDRLAAIGLFRGCTRRQLGELAKLTTEMEVASGAVLCREGDVGRECFVVRDGLAVVTIAGEEVATIGPGECFGELALLDGAPRAATVTAVTDLSVVVLSRREFDHLLMRLPVISRRILCAVAARLRAVDNELQHLRLTA